jgi:hypothetical protein
MDSRNPVSRLVVGIVGSDPSMYSIRLFLAGLLDALLAGVERTLLALGGILHVLAGLGV